MLSTYQQLDEYRHAFNELIDELLNSSEQAVVDTLEMVGHRMTTVPLLLKTLGRQNAYGKSVLATLVKEQRINNRRDAKPSGYGLPNWSG